MVVLESSLSSRYFKRGLELDLLEKLGRGVPYVLGIYLLVKFGEIFIAGDARYLFTSGLMSVLFWTEILMGAVIPLILFSIKRIRSSANGILTSAIILLVGMILNRFNVSWFAVKHPDPITYLPTFMANHVHYWPSLPEVSVSIGIFSAGILAFGLIAKYFPLFEDEQHQHATGD
jgi:Ni/Fe-hydrogenase subunit HybB-like protein